jgi:hypothetical protein
MCKGELLEFTETLRHECKNKTIFEAWRICGSNLEWHTNWPKLMQLWQKKIILIPSSIAICERGFSKRMQSKATCTTGGTWRPLMLLCGFLFVGLKWMQWIGLPSSTFGETCETEGYLRSIDIIFLLQIIQKISFLKYCVSQILRWHFGIKCRCQLTFNFVFENVTWHFGFGVARHMKFVKHTHWWPSKLRGRGIDAPITPNFPPGFNCEIVGDYVQI